MYQALPTAAWDKAVKYNVNLLFLEFSLIHMSEEDTVPLAEVVCHVSSLFKTRLRWNEHGTSFPHKAWFHTN